MDFAYAVRVFERGDNIGLLFFRHAVAVRVVPDGKRWGRPGIRSRLERLPGNDEARLQVAERCEYKISPSLAHMGERVPSPSHCRWSFFCTGEQSMKREYVKEDFVWKRLDCDRVMVNHLGRPLRQRA